MSDTPNVSSVLITLALLDELMDTAEATFLAVDANVHMRVEKLKAVQAHFESRMTNPAPPPKATKTKTNGRPAN